MSGTNGNGTLVKAAKIIGIMVGVITILTVWIYIVNDRATIWAKVNDVEKRTGAMEKVFEQHLKETNERSKDLNEIKYNLKAFFKTNHLQWEEF